MKKLLTILSSFALTATTASTVVACDDNKTKKAEVPKSEDLTARQKANHAAEELEDLELVISIGNDKKTKDKIISAIETASEVVEILNRYGASINGELTLELSNGSDLKNSDIKDGLVLKVSGTLEVDAETADFELPNVKIAITTPNNAHKLQANNAVKAFLALEDKIKINALTLAENDKVSALNAELFAETEINNILKGDAKVKTGKFTLKVGSADATNTNLIAGNAVTVSGKIEVNGQESDEEFSFKVVLDKIAPDSIVEHANEIAQKISKDEKFKNITFNLSSFKTNNKVDELKSEIVKFIKSKMTDSLKDSFNLEISDLKLKVAGADATDTNLIAGKDVRISGRVEINGKKSDHEFSCYGTLIKEQDPTDSAKELANEITQMILEYTSTQKR